jgi:hypothetical protein
MRLRPLLARCMLLALPLVAAPTSAQAQPKPEIRSATFVWDEKHVLRVTVGYRDIVDDSVTANLAGGLPTTIVTQAFLFAEAGGRALAAAYRSCRVTYDLWDEVYRIEISQSGTADAVAASPTLEGVLRRCAEADRMPLTYRAIVQGKGPLYVAMVVEVNPVSGEVLDRIRRWVSRSTTTTGTPAPGDALFGSFVGLFVTRIGSADRELRFRTQLVQP